VKLLVAFGTLALFAAVFTGCTETDYVLGGAPEGSAGASSTGGSGGSSAAGGLGPFSTPTLVNGLSLPYSSDDDPSLTADMLEIYFNSDRPGGVGGFDIWRSVRASSDAPGGFPEVVPQLSSSGVETRASVEPDGLTIWVTTRPFGGTAGYDIWVSRRASRDDPWNPMSYVAGLSSWDDDMATAPGGGVDAIYLARRPLGTEPYDMYRFDRIGAGFGEAIAIDELNTPGSESDPFVTADGLSMFLTMQDLGTLWDDIYVAHRTAPDLPFGAAVPVSELNTDWSDNDIWVSPDLRTAFFASNRNGGALNIYEAHR
jgi:hypothetical protein